MYTVDNEKKVGVWNDHEKGHISSYPYCHVIFDTRTSPIMLAVERSEAFRNPDKLAKEYLQQCLQKLFDEQKLDVLVVPCKRKGNFWDIIHEQIDRHEDQVKKVAFMFPPLEGDEAPMLESVDSEGKVSKYSVGERVRSIMSLGRASKAARNTYNMESEKDGCLLFDETQEDMRQIADLCLQNKKRYQLSVHFRYYGAYRLGNDAKLLVSMKDYFLHDYEQGVMVMGDEKYDIYDWLNRAREMAFNSGKDGLKKQIKQRRTGTRKA